MAGKAFKRGEVLVAIMNNTQDFTIAQEELWYRIPVSSVNKWLKDRWPPEWLAFYQTKIFGEEAYAVNYFTRVKEIRSVRRHKIFPHEPLNEKTNRRYYQILFESLQKLPQPILSRKLRRIIFIPTIWEKFINAVEINDLYDESPLEDRLWAEFKRRNIPAERQFAIQIEGKYYFLDFAILCVDGDIDVETDGDTYHTENKKSGKDRPRDNILTSSGWKVLRFNTEEIEEQTEDKCIHRVAKTINLLGGVDEDKLLPRRIEINLDGSQQLGLFDDLE